MSISFHLRTLYRVHNNIMMYGLRINYQVYRHGAARRGAAINLQKYVVYTENNVHYYKILMTNDSFIVRIVCTRILHRIQRYIVSLLWIYILINSIINGVSNAICVSAVYIVRELNVYHESRL